MLKKLYFVVMASLILIGAIGAMSNSDVETLWTKHTVVVASGDTVWSIAERYEGENDNVRSLVYRIVRVNKLADASYLQVGQKLVVPVRRFE